MKALFDPSHVTPTMPHKHWIPILGLYTGARLNQLAKLQVEEIEQIDGIWGIHIRRPVKNRSSKRFVPLRQEVLDLGFTDYVKSIKQARFEQVFPGLPQDGNGSGDPVSTGVLIAVDVIGEKNPSHAFHAKSNDFEVTASCMMSKVSPIYIKTDESGCFDIRLLDTKANASVYLKGYRYTR